MMLLLISLYHIYTHLKQIWNFMLLTSWWFQRSFGNFTPNFGGRFPIWRAYCSKWVETTNQLSLPFACFKLDQIQQDMNWHVFPGLLFPDFAYLSSNGFPAYCLATSSRNLNQHRGWIEYPQNFGWWKLPQDNPKSNLMNQLQQSKGAKGNLIFSIIFLGGGFKTYFYFYPYLGTWSKLTNMFQIGWNYQLTTN